MYNLSPNDIKSTKLREVFFADEPRAYIIAEVGINHNGDLEKALALIDAAVSAGVDAVKFQKRSLDQIYSRAMLQDPNSAEWSFDYLLPILQEFELAESDYEIIHKHCAKLGVDLIITPFDKDSADFVSNLGIAAIKIASADMTNWELIRHCARFGLPMLISTGMWSHDDIVVCAKKFEAENMTFALLHAQSTYPAPYESVNLRYLEELKKLCPVVGYSGHERGTFIPVAAFALGCKIIEKHITFDRNDQGPDHKASMLPAEFAEMVTSIRHLEKALRPIKEVSQAELQNREAFAKSAVAKKRLAAGHVFQPEDIDFRSPGKGLFAHEVEQYFGMVLKKDVPEGLYIAKTDFEKELKISDWKTFSFRKAWGVKCRFHDYREYAQLNSPVIEFHCSQTDLDVAFTEKNSSQALIIHAPEIYDRKLVDICSTDQRRVSESLEILQRSIDKTLEIGANFPAAKPKLVLHLGGMFLDDPVHVDTRSMIERALENFSKLVFDPDLIELLPENLPPRPWYLGGEWHQYGFMKSEDMTWFCEQAKLGMTFDICHAYLYCNLYKVDFLSYSREVLPYVKHMHVSDAAGVNGEGLQVGEGEMDFEPFFRLIKDSEFSWVAEIWSGHLHHGSGTYRAMRTLEEFKCGL